jgi:hypothetical protein
MKDRENSIMAANFSTDFDTILPRHVDRQVSRGTDQGPVTVTTSVLRGRETLLDTELCAPKIDLADIARGRRITAVAAAELELMPRRSARPKRPGPLARAERRLALFLRRVAQSL